jgi:serine/threonine protein kinase/tetratricopeptide (TPR) repeat protein
MANAAAELDRRIGAFESAWAAGPPPDPTAFLPPPDDPQYLPVLSELIRVDLEFRRRRGEAAGLDRYRAAFPALFDDASLLRELAFEEYRLRVAAGERTHPREYASRYGIDTAGWPQPHAHPSSTPTRVLADAVGPAPLFPEPGETVSGFRVLAELGRGSFGRAYLAEQTGLAGRRVAVKLSTRFGLAEPETLARLQHTHIVPVYSTHQAGPFQVVVMPFLGTLTVADLLDDLRARGALPGSGQALADTLASRRGKTAPPSGSGPNEAEALTVARPAAPDVVIRTLSRFSYPEAVLWIGARLADGLAHAHARGILHRDLKPANVLLTDDGQPMLLDFNLAADSARSGPRVGGTPAYMAPEQLRQLTGEAATVDGRSDMFSLGVVLFEMLTGRHPFPPPGKRNADSVTELLRLRSAAPPDLRSMNAAVSPSAAAIVRKCLEPAPARRYASAKDLAEDLDRQLAHQPLAHTREPSPRERFRKWRRRHPRLASSGSVAALAGVVVLLLAGAVLARHERVRQLEAETVRQGAGEKFRTFKAEARDALPLLQVLGHDPKKREEGERRVRALLAGYAVVDDAEWASRPAVALLPEADRLVLREQAAGMLMTLARVGADRAIKLPPGPERDAGLDAALALIDRAEAAYGPDLVPRAVLMDRAEVAARLGRPEARPGDKELRSAPAGAREAYLAGTALVARGQYRDAVRLLEDATAGDPRQFWAWFNLGIAYLGLSNDAKAEGCFNACVALEPDATPGYFNRGLSRLNRKLFAPAEADFTAALRLKPDLIDARVNRALARLGQGRTAEAEVDATEAIARGASETRLYFLRADIRDRRGNKAGAAEDRAAGLAKTPADEPSWVARGLARADTDPNGALADFDEALKINPRSFPALQNKAYVLSEKLNKPAESIAALDRAIELYPDSHPSLAGRAVLLARKGDRPAAHRDAERCLGQNPGADIVYQLAGAYALTSKEKPEDARVALRLLADALGRGYGFSLLAIDTDLDPIRGTKEFQKLLDAAKAVQQSGPNRTQGQ